MYEQVLRRLIGDDYELVGDEAKALCPVHEQRTGKPDHKPSFYFNIESGLCYCFSCDFRGNAHILWNLLRGTELELDEEIPEDEQVSALRRRLEKIPVTGFHLPTVMDEKDLESFRMPTREMLESRGILSSAAYTLELRANEGAWIIPIRHVSTGTLMGVQIKDGSVVRNAPRGVKKGLSLFGLQSLQALQSGPVLIVESPLDVAVCLTYRISAVATYGANVTDVQMKEIRSLGEVILGFDNDVAGRRATRTVAEDLSANSIPYRVVEWPDGVKDPGDALERITDLVAGAPSSLMNRLRRL